MEQTGMFEKYQHAEIGIYEKMFLLCCVKLFKPGFSHKPLSLVL